MDGEAVGSSSFMGGMKLSSLKAKIYNSVELDLNLGYQAICR